MAPALITSLALVAAALTGCGGADDLRRDDLAVTRVVLYQNGVGYFERYGSFEGDELKLRIRPDQINDILASLTVLDTRKGGGVGSVSLPVEKNSWMVLGELPPQVRDAGGLLAVLSAFRGAEVGVVTSKGAHSGRVVGVESVYTPEGEGWRVTLLTEDSELIPIALTDIQEVELFDRTLTVGLEKALDVALGEGDWKPVELVVRFPKSGQHDVLMSYIVAMPTWKPVYRIIFEDEKARLQGWAVIDNVSGEDWTDVDLSLTAGAPISFIVDLHSPRLPARPDLTARTYTAVTEAPPDALEAWGTITPSAEESDYYGPSGAASGAWDQPSPEPQPSLKPRESAKRKAKGDYAYDEKPMVSPVPRAPSMDSSMMMDSLVSETTGQQLGALFRYDVPVPVSVPDRSSAMVTIVNSAVDAQDVFLFDPSNGSSSAQKHPYRAVLLNNSTGFFLEKGPLTIYKDATFVGEGITNQIGPGQTVFVPYSLEPSVHVEQAWDWGASEQRLVKIKDGIITIESYQLQKVDYSITNNQEAPVTLYLRFDKVPGYELKDTEAIAQGDVYFVKAVAEPGGPTKQSAVQASKGMRTLTLFDPEVNTIIELYLADASADGRVQGQLRAVLDLRKQLGDVDHRRDTLAQRQNELRYRASDLRNNLEVLGKAKANQGLRDELADKLGAVEDELSKIDRELVELGERKYALEVQQREAFETITLEETPAP